MLNTWTSLQRDWQKKQEGHTVSCNPSGLNKLPLNIAVWSKKDQSRAFLQVIDLTMLDGTKVSPQE